MEIKDLFTKKYIYNYLLILFIAISLIIQLFIYIILPILLAFGFQNIDKPIYPLYFLLYLDLLLMPLTIFLNFKLMDCLWDKIND